MRLSGIVPCFPLLCALGVSIGLAPAQCSNPWRQGTGIVGTDGEVFASAMWDPDGSGPLPARLVIAGDFTRAGSAIVNHVAMLDPTTGDWAALGSGTNDRVRALLALPNGDLIAGGSFTTAGGSAANRVARWDGSVWSPLGLGVNSWVHALTAMPNGDVIVGGQFSTAGGVACERVARWDGGAWSALGSGLGGIAPIVAALTVLPNGDLVVGGDFTTAGGLPSPCIARWNGSVWSSFAAGFPAIVSALHVLPTGVLVAGGAFPGNIASWNGTAWSPLGFGTYGYVVSLTSLPSGELVAATDRTTGFYTLGNVERWNGSSWSLEQLNAPARCVTTLPNGDFVLGGGFDQIGLVPAHKIARCSGTTWSSTGAGFDQAVQAMTVLANGDLVVGGAFTNAGGVAANRIARWNGTTWSAFGSGIGAVNPGAAVNAVAAMPNGDVVAGGRFTTAGGVAANNIARWNGVTWTPLGSGCNDTVSALLVLPNGDLVAGGLFTTAGGVPAGCVARWNGAAWSAIGTGFAPLGFPATTFPVGANALATTSNGNLVAAGGFLVGAVPGPTVQVWNGTTWTGLVGGAITPVNALVVLPNDDLVVADQLGSVRRWSGGVWSNLGAGNPGNANALVTLPNGDLVVGGYFSNSTGVPPTGLARWNGTAWSQLAMCVTGSSIESLVRLPNGDLVAGGNLLTPGTNLTANLAMLTTTCPATAASTGVGCAGAGGSNVLIATELPWLGGSYRGRATGMPPFGFAAIVTGFTPVAVPLSLVFAQGLPGCTGYTTPDFLELALPAAGTVETRIDVPANPALVGFQCHQYVLVFELDAVGQLVAVTATNALSLRVGSF